MQIRRARAAFLEKLPLLDQAVVSGGNFLQGILLARALGADGFGAWAGGQLALLFALGLNQAFVTTPMLTFFGKKSDDARPDYLAAVARLQAVVALAAGLSAMIFAPLFFENNRFSPLVFGAAVAFSLLNDFHRRRLLGQQKTGAALLLDSILMGIQLVGFGWFLAVGKLDLSLAWTIWLAANGLVAMFGFVGFAGKINGKTNFKITLFEHWQEGRWLVATAALQWFSGNFMLAASSIWLGQAALGVARMAQNTVGVLNILFLSLENTLPAPAARLFRAGNSAGLTHFLKTVFLKNGLLVVAFLLGLSAAAEPVFQLLFRQTPDGTRLVVVGFALVYALTFVALPLRIGLRTVGRSRALFLAYVASAAFSMLAAQPLLQRFGLVGLVVGLAVCQLLQLAVYGATWVGFLRKNSLENRPLETT